MAKVPLWTIILRNGVVANFQSNNVDIKQDSAGNPVIKAATKENGLSLMFSRPEQIDLILKDTSPEQVYQEEEE